MQADKTISLKNQHPPRASSPVPSVIIQSEQSQPLSPRLPLPQSINQRRCSFSHQDSSEGKFLVTHKSFPHLNTSKKQLIYNNKKRRGSEATIMDNLSSDSTPAIKFASDKRNNDFHSLFRSVSPNERLIDDYGCALQKEILLQGRLYISEHHLCFNANIFGWITNLVIAFEDIEDIEKKPTAIFIPNAILISTCSSKHFFASFLSRDQAFDQMVDLWKTLHTNRLTPVDLHEECEQIIERVHIEESDYSYSDYSCSEDEDLDQVETPITTNSSQIQDKHTLLQTSIASLPLLKHVKEDNTARRRAISESGHGAEVSKSETTVDPNYGETASQSLASLGSSFDNNSSTEKNFQRQEITQCECSKKEQHFPTIVMDNTYNTSIETMYNLLFNSSFMVKFLSEVERSTDVCIGDWIKSENSVYSRESSYIKYLGGSIGPKSTRCYLKEEILHLDTSNYVSQLTVTQTPDVPSGSSFNVKTKTCISWSGHGQVRVLVTVLVEFTKSSWLKSTIEKASLDGQQTFYKNLDAAIRKFLHSQPHKHMTHKASARRRRRKASSRRRQNHISHLYENTLQQQPSTFTEKGYLVMLSNAFIWIINHLSTLTMTQITIAFMVIMVITNLHIASSLAGLDSRLSRLQVNPTVSEYVIKDHGDAVWKILGKFDSETNPTVRTSSNLSDNPQYSTNKHVLDKKIMELEKMILRAGYNMNQVAQLVHSQEQNIMHFSN